MSSHSGVDITTGLGTTDATHTCRRKLLAHIDGMNIDMEKQFEVTKELLDDLAQSEDEYDADANRVLNRIEMRLCNRTDRISVTGRHAAIVGRRRTQMLKDRLTVMRYGVAQMGIRTELLLYSAKEDSSRRHSLSINIGERKAHHAVKLWANTGSIPTKGPKIAFDPGPLCTVPLTLCKMIPCPATRQMKTDRASIDERTVLAIPYPACMSCGTASRQSRRDGAGRPVNRANTTAHSEEGLKSEFRPDQINSNGRTSQEGDIWTTPRTIDSNDGTPSLETLSLPSLAAQYAHVQASRLEHDLDV